MNPSRLREDYEEDDVLDVIMNENENSDDSRRSRGGLTSNKRLALARDLEMRGARRPNHAMINSKA